MLSETVKNWVREWKDEGRQEGHKEASERTALKMLAKNYAPEDISELTGLSLKQIKRLAQTSQ